MNLSNIARIRIHGGDEEYQELRSMRRCSGGLLTTVVKNRDVSEDPNSYDLAFDATNQDGVLRIRGSFFETPEPKKAELFSASPMLIEYHVYVPGDDDPWVIEMELEEAAGDDEEDVFVTPKKSVEPLSSRGQPMLAKQFKDRLNDLANAVATMAPEVLDEDDGQARIHLKFLNGRCAQLERLDALSEEELGAVFYLHHTSFAQLKRAWSSVSAAIVFSVAFLFTVKINDGEKVELLLRRRPDDKHAADEFVEEILGSIQAELEELRSDELETTVKQGFARLEKLILQANPQLTEAAVRRPDKLRSSAAKKLRRKS